MNIGIIDAELLFGIRHRFPNLVCMKISSYYKNLGYNVKLILDINELKVGLFNKINYDKIFLSKVFSKTEVPDWLIKLENICIGGTGFFYDKAEFLDHNIEHSKPDYNLYNEFVEKQLKIGVKKKNLRYYTDYSIGFLTRGCFRKCDFCVNKKYSKVEKHSVLDEFTDNRKSKICLLDDNFLGYKNWEYELIKLKEINKSFQFKQGLDIRLLNEENISLLLSCKYDGDYIFAFDDIKNKELIESKLKLWREFKKSFNHRTKLYLFTAYDKEGIYSENFYKEDIVNLFERIKLLMKYSCLPYVMRYEEYKNSPYKDLYIGISKWANVPQIFVTHSYFEFIKKYDFISSHTLFLNKYPEIVGKYFNLKMSDVYNRSS